MYKVSRWLTEAQAWLDARGKGAWIAAMVIGFILFWPIGLALLFYMIWSNRMSCSARKWSHSGVRFRPSGNTAFDAYRDSTLKRLESEQDAFHSFLDRLRKSKDQAEFDRFMDERARRGSDAQDGEQDDPDTGNAQPSPA
ncbi:MAG: DUF2852 domain-containing protein [Pseudomonadota bacterium]